MSEIDDLLGALGGMPADPRLETMDAAVLAGVAVRREHGAARKGLMLTSVMALGVGLAASFASPTASRAEQVSLNTVPPSAPSNLLMGGQ
jgi:hypothetical protein